MRHYKTAFINSNFFRLNRISDRFKRISVYTFIDERQALFHSLVMNAYEREAAYVIDGINNNDVTKFDIHKVHL